MRQNDAPAGPRIEGMICTSRMRRPSRKIRALGTDVDVLDLTDAVSVVVEWLIEVQSIAGGSAKAKMPACRFVVTPNLDHAVMLRSNDEFRAAYAHASLTLADGMPLVWASKLVGDPLPQRVAGSDLVPALLAALPQGTKVYFLGASESSSQMAVARVQEDYPQLKVVGRLSPPFGFEKSAEWSDRITQDIQTSGAELVLVGLGAPKQELWVARHRQRLAGTVVLCVGATIDFLAGSVPRAPEWARRTGLEWLHRMTTDPKRLVKRYSWDALHLPLLIAQDLIEGRRRRRELGTG